MPYRLCKDCRHFVGQNAAEPPDSLCAEASIYSADGPIYQTIRLARGPRGTCGPAGVRFEHVDSSVPDQGGPTGRAVLTAFLVLLLVSGLYSAGTILAGR
jgi:hypothetical protein